MRRILLTTVAATAVMLCGCVVVVDDGGRSNDSGKAHATVSYTHHQLDTDGDARLMGADITASGRADGTVRVTSADFVAHELNAGELRVTAADIEFDGSVAGGATLRAADIQWRGPVGGDFDVAAADLDFEGSVAGAFEGRLADARLRGDFNTLDLRAGDVLIASGSTVQADVKAAIADLRHDGVIDGELRLNARTVFLNGDVNGGVDLQVDPGRWPHGDHDGLVEINGSITGGEICARRVVITGTVSGPLMVTADEAPEINGGTAADIQFTPRNGERCGNGWEG